METLGCPKNQVDSQKLQALLASQGLEAVEAVGDADLVVINTCAFIEEARAESIEVILDAADAKRSDAELVVTGCLAERYRSELLEELPEVDRVAGFGQSLTAVPVTLGPTRTGSAGAAGMAENRANGRAAAGKGTSPESASQPIPAFDLLNLPRPASDRPWAYVKVAEGCDRACGFCAIPSFRGAQRSRNPASILAEVDALQAREIVLVAQDLASYGRDKATRPATASQAPPTQGPPHRSAPIVKLVRDVARRVDRVRLLYLYPSNLSDDLIDTICETGVPYFDLSLQHVSATLLRRMRRWGNAERFLERIRTIRRREPQAAFRSSFIVGYPGETEADQDMLLAFLQEAQLDWCGFFAYSPEPGTYSTTLDGAVDAALVGERLAELSQIQDPITAQRRDQLVGATVEVLVDEPGVGRTHREAPEIDGVLNVPTTLEPGTIVPVTVTASLGCDLQATHLQAPRATQT